MMLQFSLLSAIIHFCSWESILGITSSTTEKTYPPVEDAPYDYRFKLHSHPDLDLCNETVKCMMITKGNIDEDFLRYFVYKIGAVILETKKGVYQCANSANYTSPNRAENYEFYRQTGRSIARSIVDWYLYVIHLVKLNTLSDNRIEFLGTHNYADVTSKMKLHQLWAMEHSFSQDVLKLAWRMKQRICLQLLKLSANFYRHSLGEIKHFDNLTFSMEYNELVYTS